MSDERKPLIEHMAERIDQLEAKVAALTAERDALRARPNWEHLARLGHAAAGRWQDMAETLWEELQERHNDDCPAHHRHPLIAYRSEESRGECDCLNIIRVKWDELTNAADWADDDDDDDVPQPDNSPPPVEGGQ